MRRISKPCWPPGDVYPDGHTPASLRDAENAYLTALPGESNQASFARSEFDQLDKKKLRHVMYREQRSLCIYCEREVEREIGEGYPLPRIDHWYPLSRDPDLALHWKNLYVSCPPRETCETCDAAKCDHPFRWGDANSHMPWPVCFPYEDVVGFTRRGEVYVRSDVAWLPASIRRALELAIAGRTDGAHAQERRGIVNLNHPALVEARAEAVDGERKRMERDFPNRTETRNDREQRASRLLSMDRFLPFVSIRVAWLRKTLGRGR